MTAATRSVPLNGSSTCRRSTLPYRSNSAGLSRRMKDHHNSTATAMTPASRTASRTNLGIGSPAFGPAAHATPGGFRTYGTRRDRLADGRALISLRLNPEMRAHFGRNLRIGHLVGGLYGLDPRLGFRLDQPLVQFALGLAWAEQQQAIVIADGRYDRIIINIELARERP